MLNFSKNTNKIWAALAVLVVILLVAVNIDYTSAAGSTFSANLLVNGGFEQSTDYGSTDLGPGWSPIQTQFSYGSGQLTLNPFPFGHTGTKSASIISGEGQNNTGSIIQTVQLSNGTYDFKLSGWSWQYESDTQDNDAWVRGDLYTNPSDYIVGDASNFGGVASDVVNGISNGTKWIHISNTFNNVSVQGGSVSLIVTQRANGYGNIGHGAAQSDDWSLTAKKIN